ncbi:hypothetical protein B0H14DRAFT_3462078 [Mycena olivaceomarginata]|nr:hypothetical protein B0H14DRAFT_3462078 [Mycena olivaceomarginata]
MADPANPPTPTPLASLTPETLATIAAFATAFAQQQNQPPPPPPPPVVPPFAGSRATTEFGGKSLPALFPSIESKIIMDIVSHAFMPLDLPRLLSPLAARQDYVAPPYTNTSNKSQNHQKMAQKIEFPPPRRLLAIKRHRSVSTQDKLSSTCQEDQSAAKMS